MNLEKQQRAQNTIKRLTVDEKEITDKANILEHKTELYETLFQTREQKTAIEIKYLLSNIDIPKLFEGEAKLCQEDLAKKDLHDSLKSM